MTLGAIVIPAVALALCFGGMWFAWRLVAGAERAEAEDAPRPPPEQRPTPARRGIAGPLIALAVMALGLGGIGLIAARSLGMASPLLVAGALAAGFGLLGAGLMWALRRRRSGR